MSRPALSADGTVLFVGSFDGYFYALAAVNGSIIWKVPCGKQEIRSGATVSRDGSIVYVGSGNPGGSLHAFYTKDGSSKWDFDAKKVVPGNPCLSADGATVYVGSGTWDVFAVNTADGTEKWRYHTGNTFPDISRATRRR